MEMINQLMYVCLSEWDALISVIDPSKLGFDLWCELQICNLELCKHEMHINACASSVILGDKYNISV